MTVVSVIAIEIVRRERHRYNDYKSDYRENRRRGTILTDAEFLARRESG